MAVYAVGDLQGCYDPFRRLLDRLDFDAGRDRLWLTGDLVNRGPDSLSVLRFIRELGDAVVAVLGNHDLHLLALGLTDTRAAQPGDTLDGLLAADDLASLLEWLRHRPLLHCDERLDFMLVHAGIPPLWDRRIALARAAELESALRGPGHGELLAHLFDETPPAWSDRLSGPQRLRYIASAFTRLRYCTADGEPDYADKGPPGTQGAHLLPWFGLPDRACAGERIVFGHWATLGRVTERGIFPLDGGCAWGGHLAALRLDAPNQEVLRIDCPAAAPTPFQGVDAAVQR